MQQRRTTLNDGYTLPQLGYGVWQVPDEEAEQVVGAALEAGYRHIDTARAYGNEAGVGRAIARAAIPKDEICIATKLWNADQGYDSTLEAAEASRRRLEVEYIDLYLIHWAMPARQLYRDTWRAFVELQQRGTVRSIGVCNFPERQLDEIIADTGVTPAVHQIELHPFFNQAAMRQTNAERGIVTEAWSPLGQGGDILRNEQIVRIAATHEATPAQVVLAWHLALDNVVIPKSVTPSRIVENFRAQDIHLSAADVQAINSLDNGGRIGADPAEANHLTPRGRFHFEV